MSATNYRVDFDDVLAFMQTLYNTGGTDRKWVAAIDTGASSITLTNQGKTELTIAISDYSGFDQAVKTFINHVTGRAETV